MKKIISVFLAILIAFSSMSALTLTVNATDVCSHTYGDWVTDVSATCTTTGRRHRECSLCGNVETGTIDKASHSCSEWVTNVEATCTRSGSKSGYCSTCNRNVTVTINALGHSYSPEVFSDIPEGKIIGTSTKNCSRCGDVSTTTINYTPIYTVEDLRNIDNNLNADYLLMNDIDLSEATGVNGQFNYNGFGWRPIGAAWEDGNFSSNAFTGVFNGNGHTISGMKINVNNYMSNVYDEIDIGLFGKIDVNTSHGKVLNLNMSDVQIDCNSDKFSTIYVGSIAGRAIGQIDYCNTSGKINAISSDAKIYVGGFLGFSGRLEQFKYNNNNVDIYCKSNSGDIYVGGLFGVVKTKSNFSSCSNFGSIEGYSINNKESLIGGLSGGITSYNSIITCTCSDLFNAGNVKGPSSDTGGIFGKQYRNVFAQTKLVNSYNVGLVQYTLDEGKTWSLGDAISTRKSGLAVGGSVSNTYYLLSTGNSSSSTVLDENQMANQSSFVDFDFSDVWTFANSNSYKYPVLKNSFCNKYGHGATEWKIVKEATCGINGERCFACENCGLYFEKETILATNVHTFGSLVITRTPTKDINGEGYRECIDCGLIQYESIEPVLDSGSCGPNLTWTFEEGVLTLYGYGDMDEWTDETQVPWHDYRALITTAVFPDELTSLGNYSFYNCEALVNAAYPRDLNKIGAYAITNCAAVPGVVNPTETIATFKSDNSGRHYKIFKVSDNYEFTHAIENCTFTSNIVPATFNEQGYTEHVCAKCKYTYKDNIIPPLAGNNVLTTNQDEETLILFNSGLTSKSGVCNGSVSSCKNPAWDTLTNNNYDIYGRMGYAACSSRIRLGLGFYIESKVTENAIVSINAYDVDEESGEYDEVILVDETMGTETVVGTLSGMNDQWNNTKITIPAEKFTKGHIYHFEVQIKDTRGSCTWWVYVRNVALQISCLGKETEATFTESTLDATIDENGIVSTNLSLATTDERNFKVEFDAVCANYQYGSHFVDITTSTTIKKFSSNFMLDTGAPKGVYAITAYIKDDNGNVLKTLTTNVGYTYYAVAYDSNGGTNVIPTDNVPYSIGSTVTVLFNAVPTRLGYIFRGWSTENNAIEATYTSDGRKSFVMKDSDVTLYAVWQKIECNEHVFVSEITKAATCTSEGELTQTCELCGHQIKVPITPEHNYAETARVDASCTVDGYVEYTCAFCGDVYTETLTQSHQYKAEITQAPKNGVNGIITYTCVNCGHSFTEELLGDGSHVLLVQDIVPWSIDNNPKLLNRLVDEGYIDGWTLTTTKDFLNVNLEEYEVILVANDQTTATYNQLASFNDKLCEYAQAGGTIVYGACDHGWRNGNISYTLPGGVKKANYYSNSNYIVDYNSHIVKGDLTDNNALTNSELYGTFCSHTYFDSNTLPVGSNVILTDANGNPTLVEYSYGDGKIIASGLTWEFYYSRVYGNLQDNFSKSVYDDLIISALSNNWCIGCKHATQTEIREATCLNDGYIREICSECNEIISETTLYATGHDASGEYHIIKKATCTTDGLKELYCAKCNVLIAGDIVIKASGHEYGDWIEETTATCVQEGVRSRYCSHSAETKEYEACAEFERKTVLLAPHEYSVIIPTMEATCIEDGLGYRTCSTCGNIKNEVISATGHNYSTTWIEDIPATCTEVGYESRVCANCNDKIDEREIQPLGHTTNNWTYSSELTCTTDEMRYGNCDRCGTYIEETTLSLGHQYANAWTIDKEATCTESGEKSRYCTVCGERGYITEISPNGHSFGDWTVVTEATADANGSEERTCSVCSLVETREIVYVDPEYVLSGTVSVSPTNLYVGSIATVGISGLTVGNGGTFECTYQWNLNGNPIEGETGTSYTVKEEDLGKKLTVTVTAVEPYQGSITSSTKTVYLNNIENLAAANTQEGVKLTWDAVEGATKYTIYRAQKGVLNIWSYSSIGTAEELEFVDTTAKDGNKYRYRIVASNDVATSLPQGNSLNPYIEHHYLSIPQITGHILDDGSGVEIRWGIRLLAGMVWNHDNITATVYGRSATGDWVELGEATDYYIYCGTEFDYFKIRRSVEEVITLDCGNQENVTYFSAFSNEVCIYAIQQPEVYAYSAPCGIELMWNPVSRATSYNVYRDGQLIATVTDPYYYDYNVEDYFEYEYEIEATDGIVSSWKSWVRRATVKYHNFSEPQIITEPTCTTEGLGIVTCYDCGYEEFSYLSPTGHRTSGVWTIDKEATCTSNGSKSKHCLVCDTKLNKTTITATGHIYGPLEYEKVPTCEEGGILKQTCETCQHTKTSNLPKLGHNYSPDWTIDIMPTCTEAGSMSHKCSRCDSVSDVTVIEPLGHDYSTEYTFDIKPTCTEPGEKSYHCNNCDDRIDIQVVEALGHNFDNKWTIDIEPTCNENGEKSHRCLNCRERTDITAIAATGHSYSDWNIAKEATCFEEGLKYKECENCHETVYEDLPAGNHVYGGWKVTATATCTEEGSKVRTCSLCDHEDIQLIDALGHYYSTNWSVDTEATCEEDGSMSHHCIRCNDKKDITVLPATGHCFSGWLVADEATCEKDGTLYRECEVCATRETQGTSATGHIYSTIWTVDVVPTCTETGIKSHHCLNCDARKDVTQIMATGHFYGAWITDVESTCTATGQRHKTCDSCKNSIYETVDAYGHNYSTRWTIDIEPTCLEEGSKSHHCLRCDDKTDITIILVSGHIFGKWYIAKEATMDEPGIKAHDCYNCDLIESQEIPKLQKYTATFIADGEIVAVVDFPEDATEIDEPEVPKKNRYVGKWEEYVPENKNIVIYAEYTKIDSDGLNEISTDHTVDYYSSSGMVDINLFASSPSKNIIINSSKSVPLDIVLVLDQSGSMAEPYGNTKRDALVDAVNKFNASVYENAVANGVDHRIAIVGFGMGNDDYGRVGSSDYIPRYCNTNLLTAGGNPISYNDITESNYRNAFVTVNAGGTINPLLTTAVNNIDAKGATMANLGLEMAASIFANNPTTDRQRIVVFLTDGVPTSGSSFEYGVANAALENVYQLKDTYNATVYSVGLFDSETTNNKNVNNFMNYVSSNYSEKNLLNSKRDVTTPAPADYYMSISDTSKLSGIFTTIAEESVIQTGVFDNATIVYTVSKYFTLTSVQEEALRKSTIETLGVTDDDIVITRNVDGTTKIVINNVHPTLKGSEFVIDFTFQVTANGSTRRSGTYAVNTLDSGILLPNSEEYENVFDAKTVDIIGSSGIATFTINGIPYHIERLTSSETVIAPAVSFDEDYHFSGWNVPNNYKLNNASETFDATLTRNEYSITWNIDGELIVEYYSVGDVITPPTVTFDSTGDLFACWDTDVPHTMPAENLTITALYDVHYHNYEVTKNFNSCEEGGMLHYECQCGSEYDEAIEPSNHEWHAISGPASETNNSTVGFRCEHCGAVHDNSLEFIRIQKDNGNNKGKAVYELYFKNNSSGENEQPGETVSISVPLDQCFSDVPEGMKIEVYRVNDDGTRTKLKATSDGDYLVFETDHFSTYEFVYGDEVIPDVQECHDYVDGICSICGEESVVFDATDMHIEYLTYGENTVSDIKDNLKHKDTYVKIFSIDGTLLEDTDLVGTGATVGIYDSQTDSFIESYTIVLYGDVNGDGLINDTDKEIITSVANCTGTIDNKWCLMAADVNHDGAVDAFDVIETELQTLDMHNIEQKSKNDFLIKEPDEE